MCGTNMHDNAAYLGKKFAGIRREEKIENVKMSERSVVRCQAINVYVQNM